MNARHRRNGWKHVKRGVRFGVSYRGYPLRAVRNSSDVLPWSLHEYHVNKWHWQENFLSFPRLVQAVADDDYGCPF